MSVKEKGSCNVSMHLYAERTLVPLMTERQKSAKCETVGWSKRGGNLHRSGQGRHQGLN
jgi:hypothetical protein